LGVIEMQTLVEMQRTMKAKETNRSNIGQGALLLKIVGSILMLIIGFDFVLQLLFNPLEQLNEFDALQWQQSFQTELVDRGVIALIGLVLIYLGTLLTPKPAQSSTDPDFGPNPVADSRFWVFVLASLLGLLYLIIPILHFQATGNMLSKATAELDNRETKAQQQIQGKQQQLSSIANSGQIDELLKSEQIDPAQKQLLSQIKANPNLIQQIQQQDQVQLSQMKADKTKAVDSLNRETLVSRLRTEIRSVLIAIAFILIGWTGLRNVLKG
jgi:hypothetical protein